MLLVGSCSQDIESAKIDDIPSIITPEKENSESPTPLGETVFKIVEEMPLFGDCTTKECSDKNLIDYLYSNLKYPQDALEAGIEGRVYVQFVVNQDGYISDVNVVRGIDGSIDDAALKVVQDINLLKTAFQPGKQRGQAVKVQYTLPISFKLEGKAS